MPDESPLSPDLIAQLRCPESRQPLSLANASQLAEIQRSAESRDWEGALVREDGTLAYPIREGFPILLVSEAHSLNSEAS